MVRIPIKASKALSQWDKRFFSLAQLVGSWSEDSSRKVGAVIVGPFNEVRSIGFNGIPRNVSLSTYNINLQGYGEKYYWFEHAERNAIYNAARAGISISGCKIYSTLFPCADCMRAIIQSGISELLSMAPPKEDKYFSRSYEISLIMATESGLEFSIFEKI